MKSKSIFQSKSQIMSSHQKFVESFNLSLRYREMCVKSLLELSQISDAYEATHGVLQLLNDI